MNILSQPARLYAGITAMFRIFKLNARPLAWVIVVLLIVLFFIPYTLPGTTPISLGAYGGLSVLPIIVAAFFWERKGSIFTTLLIICGFGLVDCLKLNFPWSRQDLYNLLIGGGSIFVFALVIGQFSHISRQLARAHQRAREAEVQIALAYEQQVELNALKDQFILNVSHELRTPLTQVYGYLELLGKFGMTLDSETQSSFISSATRGCEELLLLINNVLDVGRMGQNEHAHRKEELFLVDIVQGVLEQFEPQKRQEHTIYLEVAEEMVVLADAQYLRQVLRNLISNAFKYSPLHSEVEIHATLQEPSIHEPQCSVYACICVQDEGFGIAPDDVPLLFGKFVRLQRDVGGPIRGTGLGLYISKSLVEAMGGRIWVESAGVPGQGSRFYFTLPTSVGAASMAS